MTTVAQWTVSQCPIAPPSQSATFVQPPAFEGQAPRTLTTPQPGATITVNGTTFSCDLMRRTPALIVQRFNDFIPGIASLDRNGRIVLVGSPTITGDSALIAALGLA